MPTGIYVRTEYHKQKIGQALKGKKRPPFGEEWKRHIREARAKQVFTDKTRRKMSLTRKGKKRPPFSEEWKRQLSISHKGQKAWNKGQKLPRLSGKNHWHWRGGITQINRIIRNSIKYKLWQEAVFKRDNYTCQKCGGRGGDKNAHHIKSFANHPELRFEVSNGMTLCVKCHNNTKSNLERKPKNGKTNFVQ